MWHRRATPPSNLEYEQESLIRRIKERKTEEELQHVLAANLLMKGYNVRKPKTN